MSRDPSKSRPLSANVKRMMWLERAAPKNKKVMSEQRDFTEKDKIYCHKQGTLFMEAAAMGFPMEKFVPLYMTSQLAGVLDYCFSFSNEVETALTGLLQIPVLIQNPRTIIESLYWIEDIVSKAKETDNKSLVLSRAYEADFRHTPKALLELPSTENTDIDYLSYAYWLGYMYRCECLIHDESSRMVYGAFDESVMHRAYTEIIRSKFGEKNLTDCAKEICAFLDKLLVEKIWPESNHKKYI